MAGTPGFDFAHGSVLMVQPAWSGNNELYVQRDMAQIATVSAGELLEPGEIVLRQGELCHAVDHGHGIQLRS